ncbi:MAG: response regulator [Deltaproteobacteria bacterium]|nr:response regulator [Deltaproteobacteria bacterium]
MSEQQSKRILVVDADDKSRAILVASLKPLGHHVTTAVDGQDALQKIVAEPPDMIILDVMMPRLDVMMPRMNGYEVVGRMKGHDENRFIPIVMVSGLKDEKARVAAFDAGVDDFLIKPVGRTELKARVGSLLKVKAYHDHVRSRHKKLEAEVEARTIQLQRAREKINLAARETILKLSRAAEYKDEETGAHILRMSHYAAAITRTLGLGDELAETILHVSPMHDIGKIGTPDSILFKPGPLDTDEREVMQQHTVVGGMILEGSDSDCIQMAEQIARCHHEKWDGTGYPRGLKGQEIPLESRIAALADFFDAVTSSRPYRKQPFTPAKASSMILEGRGTHFDPEVVDAFLKSEEVILSIRCRYQDRKDSRFNKRASEDSSMTVLGQ